ncbi:ArnT family glycosyltransferase [Merismopedia glauca]|uniref:Phospholipid carrier-dependent glycosyltransferase n=1 Tax=Merismopedia glauca CCAP 1448/3 TaxID=1296344 RepID=A0A2T1C715_9CYAN|nr:glycosyltransferase family 39 protein [Merismopedia glauca]PSB03937.1 phospholipid carrier-dependent glycosyltransferase [Merismopedia glauca CCAP 1448/3]
MKDRIVDDDKLSQGQRSAQVEISWVIGLLVAALVLFVTNLGTLPLRDWDEGTVAQVAKEIAFSDWSDRRWLFPTLYGEPYLNKPPLMHWLIALTYHFGGVNEWTTRLPGAILSAISVPLLYSVGREVFLSRTPCIYSALVYLTFLPVVRHGRLAMLDGAVLCFFMLLIWSVLRARRDLRYGLVTGIALGLICLTKGMMGLILGAIALLFIAWDTPRLLASLYLWLGLGLGCLPVAGWYAAQWYHYRELFWEVGVLGQSFSRIWTPVEQHHGPPWYYLLEILKYGWPCLLFIPQGIQLAWSNCNLGWAKLALVWSSVYLVAISMMATKLPWYVLPIYPALSLIVGAQLYETETHWSSNYRYLKTWTIGLTILGLGSAVAGVYFSGFWSQADLGLVLILVAFSLTLLVGAILLAQRDRQFIVILLWGTYVSLFLFIKSPHWIWELNEAFPVKPVATMVKAFTPEGETIYTSFEYSRPSLNFYSDRQVMAVSLDEIRQHWQEREPVYLLLEPKAIATLKLPHAQRLDTTGGWTLLTRQLP